MSHTCKSIVKEGHYFDIACLGVDEAECLSEERDNNGIKARFTAKSGMALNVSFASVKFENC